jgi:predicted glycosyltransferase
MAGKEILFYSGAIGLGHVVRDLAIVRELRRRDPLLHVSWLAMGPSARLLQQAGELVLLESGDFSDDTAVAESVATGSSLNILTYARGARSTWRHNAEAFAALVSDRTFDLVIGDESYEISIFLAQHPEALRAPYVVIADFVGIEAMTSRLAERAVREYFNWVWVRTDRALSSSRSTLFLFVGEPDDAPPRSMGWRLPTSRAHTEQFYSFVGWVLPFDAAALADRQRLREALGYDERPLIVVSVGGTIVGQDLLELCLDALPLVRQRVAGAQMVLVCGPEITVAESGGEGLEVRGFVPDLFRHFAASDLAIVQGGGTTTIELTALRRPFLYFPVEEHFEQQRVIAERLARYGAGVRMSYRACTPRQLADAVAANLGTAVDSAEIPVDGAQRAAELIRKLL